MATEEVVAKEFARPRSIFFRKRRFLGPVPSLDKGRWTKRMRVEHGMVDR